MKEHGGWSADRCAPALAHPHGLGIATRNALRCGAFRVELEDLRVKTKKPSMYKVIMLNDDYTPMEFVIHVLKQFFGRSNIEASNIMMNVHKRGVGVCGVYSFEVAESKAQKTMQYARQNEHPLQLQLEKE